MPNLVIAPGQKFLHVEKVRLTKNMDHSVVGLIDPDPANEALLVAERPACGFIDWLGGLQEFWFTAPASGRDRLRGRLEADSFRPTHTARAAR